MSDSDIDLSPEFLLRAAREEMEAERLHYLMRAAREEMEAERLRDWELNKKAKQLREDYLKHPIADADADFQDFPQGTVGDYIVADKGVEAEELRLALAYPLREMLWFEHGILPPAIPDKDSLQNIYAIMKPGMIDDMWKPCVIRKGLDANDFKVLFLGAASEDGLSLVSVVKGLTKNSKPFYRTYLKKEDKKA